MHCTCMWLINIAHFIGWINIPRSIISIIVKLVERTMITEALTDMYLLSSSIGVCLSARDCSWLIGVSCCLLLSIYPPRPTSGLWVRTAGDCVYCRGMGLSRGKECGLGLALCCLMCLGIICISILSPFLYPKTQQPDLQHWSTSNIQLESLIP